MKTTYHQRKDNEGWSVVSHQEFKIECCDCGLVHRMVVIGREGQVIGLAAARDNRATGQRRRRRVKQ